MNNNAADGLAPLGDVIKRHGLEAKKSFGQHFLLDLNLTARIARAAGDISGTDVVEIGPGPGGLTRGLLMQGARRVVAIERDRRCIAALEEVSAAYPGRLEIIEGDALEIDPVSVSAAPRRIVANLPYNIATPLLIGWLDRIGDYQSLTVMLQKEVADRLTAVPGTKAYGRLSILIGWLCHVRHEFSVSARAFTPPPKVESSVVTLTPRAAPLAPADRQALERVTQAAFGQRRKMLRGSLKALGLVDALEGLGIQPTDRAENLSIAQFCALARALDGA